MAKATLDFQGKRYTYEFEMPKAPTKHNMAVAIATAKGKYEGRRSYTGQPKDYNLIMEMLSHNSTYMYKDDSREFDYNADADHRNNQERPFRVKCCSDLACKKCSGNGEYITRLVWRTGETQNHTLIIDIDGKDIENLKTVKKYYEDLFGYKFTAVSTGNGFWLFSSKKYINVREWKYHNCKILMPSMDICNMDSYMRNLFALDRENKFGGNISEVVKNSEYYNGVGNFDVMFTLLSIKRGHHTIRTSKKHDDDKIEIVYV